MPTRCSSLRCILGSLGAHFGGRGHARLRWPVRSTLPVDRSWDALPRFRFYGAKLLALLPCICQFARVVKGVDLRSTTGNCAWVRTPQLTSKQVGGSVMVVLDVEATIRLLS